MSEDVLSIPNDTRVRRAYGSVPDRGDNWRYGVDFNPGPDFDQLKVGRGAVMIVDSGRLYFIEVWPQTIDLPDGNVEVYYEVDTAADPVTADLIATTGGAPSAPSLLLGTIDTSGETFDDTLNRNPNETFEDVSATNGEFDSVETDAATIGNVQVTQGNIDDLSVFSANLVTLTDNDIEAIFDLSEPVDVVGGVVNGETPTELTVTFEDGTTKSFNGLGFSNGSDENGNNYSVINVPPIRNIKKLEFRVDRNGEYGYKVVTV